MGKTWKKKKIAIFYFRILKIPNLHRAAGFHLHFKWSALVHYRF